MSVYYKNKKKKQYPLENFSMLLLNLNYNYLRQYNNADTINFTVSVISTTVTVL